MSAVVLATPADVINDYNDNGVIDSCHSRADYEAAQTQTSGPAYGDLQAAIDESLRTPALVGTPEKPCDATAAETESSGVGVATLIAIPAAALLLIGAVLAARRRRGDPLGGPE